jgi:hypothetical protein
MRFVQKLEDTENEQTRKTVMDLDSELANWINHLPSDVRSAVNDTANPQMPALCRIAFFVYYSTIINLRDYLFSV